MKHVLFSFLAVLCTMTAMAQNDGSACVKAIHVDSTLVQKVEPNTFYWFTANTADLPLSVYFFPDELAKTDLEIYVDFTCEPGVYEDEKIRDVVDLAASFGIYFPLGTNCDTITIDGTLAYYMSYDRELLEVLYQLGIDYDISVYVSFRSPVSGTMQMSNIKTMTQCKDLHQRVEMRDTLYLQASKDNLFYFPVNEWKDKNISFSWTGEKALRAYGESDCEFDTLTSKIYFDFAELNSSGLAMQKMSKSDVDYAINQAEDGNIYVTFSVSEDGQIYVTDYVDHGSVTIDNCVANRKSTAIEFPAADMSMEASIPSKSYRIESAKLQNKDVRLTWKAAENKLAVAYFANFCGFELKASDPDVVDTIHFAYDEELQAMVADIPMERMNRIVNRNTDGWLFMQIYRQEAGTFAWDTYENIQPDCDTKSFLLQPNDSVEMPADYYNTSYKLVAKDWIGYRHTFTWKSTRQAYIFIADSCSFPLAPYNVHVGKYMVVNPNDSVSMSVDDIEMLNKEFTDEYGNLYLRLRSTAPGELVVRQYTNTGLFDNVIINGRDVKLVIINQSLYIQISDATSVEYYDLMGRKVELED